MQPSGLRSICSLWPKKEVGVVPLSTVFFGFVILFAIVGALRGWMKELLVTFSVVLARFIEVIGLLYVPIIDAYFAQLRQNDKPAWFYLRLFIFGILVAAGYATTRVSSRLGQRARKEEFQDTLLGLFLGLINGYLITGYVWSFMHELGYNIWGITGPQTETVQNMIDRYLPSAWLESNVPPENPVILFIAVAVSFSFVLIVFV
jgi:ABC-type multidrug transport system fused ATPase/permease subunit